MKSIKNIDFLLFDLGNVIINIDYQFTINELNKILPKEKNRLPNSFFPSQFHKQYERGHISTKEFRSAVRNHFNEGWSDDQIDNIWNSLLKDIPRERIQLIRKLRKDFGLAVLSNTNELHIKKLNDILKLEHDISSLHPLFDQVYFSHELHMAKPDMEVYEEVSKRLNTSPEKILFFDDLQENIAGAQKVGYQTQIIDHPNALLNFFENVY
ncbi:haloacid dehalogenase superfamily protein, subfamily IA, variant 3 with third motif having DD or ED [Belliella baltica DSM 15883]|uniref:Haloacid dehalogenase superfamily protein, subfamily IA, variant 3 with third motif having DD or ED n=1 Tax=Belliella baltica (strain DSM 15883 / CIP 108006 / LMG 21964 / BA134) TaxID=866536 RepID=I3Z9E8_BELBD|nr:HAD family phosphatase [Belliella baltica]AFL85866.1 haloacid dehalogenase superfamily protein, subfamily IA, variant 3 with third motif having DD or ED [Belliella baltica DSM 15883]